MWIAHNVLSHQADKNYIIDVEILTLAYHFQALFAYVTKRLLRGVWPRQRAATAITALTSTGASLVLAESISLCEASLAGLDTNMPQSVSSPGGAGCWQGGLPYC